jgi:hypothetical protein
MRVLKVGREVKMKALVVAEVGRMVGVLLGAEGSG